MAQYRFTNNGVAPRIVFNERQMPVTILPGGYAVVALDDATVRQMTRICASDPTLQVAIDEGDEPAPSPQPQPSPQPAPAPPPAPEPVEAPPPAAPEPAPEPAPASEPEPAKPPAQPAPAQPARKKSRRRA